MKEKGKMKFKKLEDGKNGIAIEVIGEDGKTKCKLRICENVQTGELDFVYGKGCPKGTIEQLAGKIATKVIRFVKEKTDDEDELV